jgi:hypothetical protein
MGYDYRIMVRCPVTGKAIDSGIRTSGRDVLSEGLFRTGTVGCPHCGGLHSFADNGYRELERVTGSNDLWRPNR